MGLRCPPDALSGMNNELIEKPNERTIMTSVFRPSRLPGVILAVLIAVTTLAIVGNAIQTITTPNMSNTAYALAPGANSANLTIPVFNSPVLLMGNCTTVGRRGVAQVTIHRTSVAPLFLQWVGLSSPFGPTVVGDWWPGGVNPHIVWLDFAHQVELRVVSASQVDVRSLIPAGGPVATGVVTMIW